MSDPSDDDIAKWAAGLSPDGAPGIAQQRAREYFGDKRYEEMVEQNNAVTNHQLGRMAAINNLLALAVLYGLVGLVGFVAVVVKYIF